MWGTGKWKWHSKAFMYLLSMHGALGKLCFSGKKSRPERAKVADPFLNIDPVLSKRTLQEYIPIEKIQ